MVVVMVLGTGCNRRRTTVEGARLRCVGSAVAEGGLIIMDIMSRNTKAMSMTMVMIVVQHKTKSIAIMITIIKMVLVTRIRKEDSENSI